MALPRTKPQPFRLLDLPGEIRNRVYGFALYHGENAGVIAPLAPKLGPRGLQGAHAIIDGKEVIVKAEIATTRAPNACRKCFNDIGSLQLNIETGPRSLQHYHGHLCNMSCLLQPALTRVSRQVREECLGYFYDVNDFHFGTQTFHGAPRAGAMTTISPNPRDWWRGVGDSNLRHIKHFRLIDRCAPKVSPTVELTVDRTGVVKTAKLDKSHTWLNVNGERVDGDVSTPEMQECLQQLKDDGIFVRGIEHAVYSSRTLGVVATDWPSMSERPVGRRRVEGTFGGDTWIHSPGRVEDDEEEGGDAQGALVARMGALGH